MSSFKRSLRIEHRVVPGRPGVTLTQDFYRAVVVTEYGLGGQEPRVEPIGDEMWSREDAVNAALTWLLREFDEHIHTER